MRTTLSFPAETRRGAEDEEGGGAKPHTPPVWPSRTCVTARPAVQLLRTRATSAYVYRHPAQGARVATASSIRGSPGNAACVASRQGALSVASRYQLEHTVDAAQSEGASSCDRIAIDSSSGRSWVKSIPKIAGGWRKRVV